MDLGHTAQGIGVLDILLPAVGIVRSLQGIQEEGCHLDLAGLLAQPVNFRVIGISKTTQGFKGEGRRFIGRIQAAFSLQEGQRSEAQHDRGAIDQGQPILTGQGNRRQAPTGKGLAPVQTVPVNQSLSLTYQNQGHMGQIGQVS